MENCPPDVATTLADLPSLLRALVNNTYLTVSILLNKDQTLAVNNGIVESTITLETLSRLLSADDRALLDIFIQSGRIDVGEMEDGKLTENAAAMAIRPGLYRQDLRKLTDRKPSKLPLIGRNPNPHARGHERTIMEAELEAGRPFAIGFMDIDALTKFQFTFARKFKLAGKLRLIIEDILHVMKLLSGPVQTGVAVLVVPGPLLRIVEDLIRFGGFLEFLRGGFVLGIRIRMVLQGQLPVRVGDISIRRVPGHVEDFVIIAFTGHRC